VLRALTSPLVARLRAEGIIRRHFFLRHWSGGPHVRLRLLACGRQAQDLAQRTVSSEASAFFAARRSETRLTAEAYDQLARVLGRWEPETAPCPLQPNNVVRFEDYRPEQHKNGAGPSLEAVEQHFEDSSDLVHEAVRDGLPARRRRWLALGGLVAACAADGPPLGQLAARLARGRAALAALLEQDDDPPALLAMYRRRQAALQGLCLAVSRNARLANAGDGFLDRWSRSVTGVWDRLRALNPAASTPATHFAVDNCAHMLFNRLGISLAEEWRLRSLALRAVTDLIAAPPAEVA